MFDDHSDVIRDIALEAASRVCAAQSHINLLIGDRGRWRACCYKLFPARFCAIGLCRVLEILCSTLLHDFHVLKQSPLFVVPALEVVAEKRLTFFACFGEGHV